MTPGRSPADVGPLLAQLSHAPRGRCSSTSRRRPARPTPARRGARSARPRRRARPRSCCRGGCWCRAGRGSCGCRARCRSRCAAATPRATGSTYRPRWRRPSGTPRRSTGRRRARPSRRYDGWSCWSTTGARTRRSPCAAARWRCATSRRPPTFAQLDEPTTALVIEVAAAAGLLATWPDPDGNPAWTPTEAFDAWCDEPAADRWTRLARAWLDTERLPYLVGTRDDAGKTRNALDPELTSRVAPETRAMTLAAARRAPVRARGGDRHRSRLGGRPARLAAAAPATVARRAGGGGPRRVRPPRHHRPRRARVVRPRPGGRRRPRSAAHAAAARRGRPRADPGRPHRRRTRAARARAGPRPPPRSPTSSRGGRRPSTASPPRPYAVRSTPAGRPTRCTPSSRRSRGPRCRSR